ncbi:amidohydrolase family protein [Streptomyces griseus]|uniref:metal-dependent hydrolase family protein n=1 Tax=Streptomyces griseus TaxID=1911 RepID=UPI00386F9DF2|nr:amidohydrolase family protein [Streptomyces griseus]WTD71125.1 amidohydrolase family protein [Streptomyces griseus]
MPPGIEAGPARTGGQRLTHVRVIDGLGGRPVDNGEVAFRDGMLTYVGPFRGDELSGADGGLPRRALPGFTVLPGFIDCHVHFAAGGIAPWQAGGMFASHFHLAAADNMRRTLEAGVTSARDLAGVDSGFRDAARAGLLQAPRLSLAIGAISPTGGHTDFVLPNGNTIPLAPRDLSTVADSDDEIRKVVRLLVRGGADVVKVCASGGITSSTSDPDHIGVPERQLRIIVEEAALRGGLPVAAHAQGAEGVHAAVKAGVTSVEHGYAVRPDTLEAMIAQGTFLVPTLSAALSLPDPTTVPRYLWEKKKKWSGIARKHLTRALRSGVKVAMGTDAGACPHGRNLAELGHLTDLGMSPMDAIVSGTRHAAELIGRSQHLGTLEAGKYADLVLTACDPLADIKALAYPTAVRMVVQGGSVVKDTTSTP